jgi:hypothetical protein
MPSTLSWTESPEAKPSYSEKEAVNVNASPASEWALERSAPGLSEVIGAITSDQIGRYSTNTMEIVGSAFTR